MSTVRHLVLLSSCIAFVGCGGDDGDSSSGGGGGGGGGPTNGGTATIGTPEIPLYVLIGGSSKPAHADLYLDSPTTRGSNVSTLDPGEIFILPKNALLTGTEYSVHIQASTGASGESYTLDFAFTTGGLDPTVPAGTALQRINEFRNQSGLDPLSTHSNFATAAIKHSGYQCQRDFQTSANAITHGETSGVSFFVDNDFANRISLANGGGATSATWNWGGSNQVYEGIDTFGGTIAVDRLWNTVYHRLPMMRAQVYRVGSGDRSNADGHANDTSPNIPSPGPGTRDYHTFEFGGLNSISTPNGVFWPADGSSGAPARFQTNFEGPDPISTSNGNGTPDDNEVGTPIHAVFPTSNSFTTLVITVTEVP